MVTASGAHDITGTVGTFLNMWTALINSIFAYTGMDILVATAAESKALSDAESMKMGARKINLRVVILYVLAVLTASFVVPRDHPFINGKAQSSGAGSLFVIAAVEAGLPNMAQFINAMFVFSAFTCAINAVYVASRVMHTLALLGYTGPEWITRRLRACRGGVPIRAVLVTGTLMLIAFIGRTGGTGVVSIERHQSLQNVLTWNTGSEPIVGQLHHLISYYLRHHLRNLSLLLQNVCPQSLASHHLWYHHEKAVLTLWGRLEDVKNYGNASEAQVAMFDRNNPRYPYKSHGQWLKAAYGGIACTILVLFNGIGPFFTHPFNTRGFIADYIGVSYNDSLSIRPLNLTHY